MSVCVGKGVFLICAILVVSTGNNSITFFNLLSGNAVTSEKCNEMTHVTIV